METNTNLHAVPHWEHINPIENRVEITFDLGVDPAKTNVEQLRRALFTTLNNDVLPQIAKDAPAGADLHVIGSDNSDFDIATVDFRVTKGAGGKWNKAADTNNATLKGNVAVRLLTDYPIAAADALSTVRSGVADDIAALIAGSFDNYVKSLRRKPKKAMRQAA